MLCLLFLKGDLMYGFVPKKKLKLLKNPIQNLIYNLVNNNNNNNRNCFQNSQEVWEISR